MYVRSYGVLPNLLRLLPSFLSLLHSKMFYYAPLVQQTTLFLRFFRGKSFFPFLFELAPPPPTHSPFATPLPNPFRFLLNGPRRKKNWSYMYLQPAAGDFCSSRPFFRHMKSKSNEKRRQFVVFAKISILGRVFAWTKSFAGPEWKDEIFD